MTGESLNILQDNLEKLQAIFPDIFSEGKIDLEKFKATFSDDINFANERYVLNWAGKSDAFKVLQIPTTATLKPCPGEGINDFPFLEHGLSRLNDDTDLNNQLNPEISKISGSDNVFIEGENLEVLKVLQKSYYNKVKCIIIDPPYNTGSDSFIYPDSFKENKADYEKRIGDKDEEGYLMKEGMFRRNSKESGHYHSNWLSMMYPRLFLAKNLLRDDGVIFVHIDDNEVHNLRLIMNEIFGEENFVGQIIWKNVTDNNPTLINLDHEYILCYSKNKSALPQAWKSYYSDAKDLLQNKYEEYKKAGKSTNEIEKLIRDFISENFEIMGFLTRYKNVDDNGIYTGSESVHNPKAGGYVYDILHPKTGGVMKMPANGYRFPHASFKELDEQKKIIYGEDENRIIKIKKYLTEFEDTLRSVIVMDGRLGSYDLKRLFDEKVFNNPKPIELLTYILSFVLEKSDIVIDFFSGSASTAEAIFKLNKKDEGNRKFILVQLPELCDENSEAFKAGYKTIADISKERIRRVINRLNHGLGGLTDDTDSEKMKMKNQLLFEEQENQRNPEISKISDNGFKVFKLSPSNFKIWRGSEITEENLVEQLEVFVDPVKPSDAGNLPSHELRQAGMLYELMLKAGYLLTDKVETKGKFFSVKDGELIIALEEMNQKIIDNIIKAQPQKVITLDHLFTGNDQLKTNTVLQMKDAGVDFKTI